MRCHSLIVLLAPAIALAASLPSKRTPTTASALPDGWSSVGCFVDSVSARALGAAYLHDDHTLTAQSCIAFCSSKGYTVAGTEYSAECYCGSALPATSATPSTCSMKCTGDSSQVCGGPDRLSVYQQTSGAGTTTNPGVDGWSSLGCVTDSQGSRSLSHFTTVDGAMTVAKCVAACQSQGFSYAGVEYAAECWCGNSFASTAASTPSGCYMPCAGNHNEFCGGPDRLNAYGVVQSGCRAPLVGGYGMVNNGGFENGFDGYTPNIVQGTFDIGLTTDYEYEGCHAAYVQPTSSPSSGNRQVQISTTLTGLQSGKNYVLTGYQGRVPTSLNAPSPDIGVTVGSQVLGHIVACAGTDGCPFDGEGGARYIQHVVPFTYGGSSPTATLTLTVTWLDSSSAGNPELLFDGFKVVAA